MKFEEYALSMLKNTEDSYVGLELDLRFDIVEFLRKNLAESQMTQATLAARLKMKPSQLNRILKAETNLTLETVARIFHALHSRPTIIEKHAHTPKTAFESPFCAKQHIVSDTPNRYAIAFIN